MEKLIIRPRGEDGYRVFSVRMKQELLDKLDAIAAEKATVMANITVAG